MIRWKFQFGDIFAVSAKHKPFYLTCAMSQLIRELYFSGDVKHDQELSESSFSDGIYLFVLLCLIENILINLNVTYKG